jgi:hypothetical protein
MGCKQPSFLMIILGCLQPIGSFVQLLLKVGCSQLFQNINASSVNFSNIQQQCNQTIQQQITNAISGVTGTPSTVSNTPLPSSSLISTTTSTTGLSMNMIYIMIGVGVMMLLLFSSSIGGVLFM